MCYSIFIINSFYDWCSKKLMSWIRSETLLWPSSRSTQSASYRRFIFSPNIHYQSHQMFQYLRHRTSLRLLSNIISETHILGKLKGSSFVWEKWKVSLFDRRSSKTETPSAVQYYDVLVYDRYIWLYWCT